MEKSHAEQSLDSLFENLAVDEASAGTTARCLVELAFIETRCRRYNLKKLRLTALSRATQCVASHGIEMPPLLKKLTEDELSRFGQRIMNAKETEFKYWDHDTIARGSLPFSILSKPTKRRIFRFLADPLKNQIQWARQSGMVDAKRLETYYDILRTLARHCESLDCLTKDDEVASLRDSLDSAKSKCDAIKEQLQQMSPSDEGTGLENKLKREQAKAALLSAQIQKHHQRQKT